MLESLETPRARVSVARESCCPNKTNYSYPSSYRVPRFIVIARALVTRNCEV
jgi:hypothetical protein